LFSRAWRAASQRGIGVTPRAAVGRRARQRATAALPRGASLATDRAETTIIITRKRTLCSDRDEPKVIRAAQIPSGVITLAQPSALASRISTPRVTYALAIAACAVALTPSEAAAPKTLWIFSTPNTAAYCGKDEPTLVPGEESIHCYRRSDGLDARIGRTGRPRISHARSERGQHVQTPYRNKFGQSLALWGINCAIRATGLTCVNPAKHGFWLGPTKGYRVF
jgi:hypothetical protein